MVKGGDQLQLTRQQHTVTEDIARHIAHTDNRNRIGLHIDAQLAEVTLYRDPGTFSGNAHLLVVVASRATGGKSVPQPETVARSNAIGDIGEGRSALVRGNHQVGVVCVMTHHVSGRHDLTIDQVIGQIEQALDEHFVTGNCLLLHFIP